MPQNLRSRSSLRNTLIGDRAFYKMVLAILIPIIIQNAISNFVNLLDNIMVGQVGTEQMSGVAIVNQLMFVFNLCVFGGISGAGIFSAQFHGANNQEGVRHCFRYKLYLCVVLVSVSALLFITHGSGLIGLYLNGETDQARAAVTLEHGTAYLRIMLLGLAPFALTQVYASTLKETGETRLPMFAGVAAVCVNLVFNYLLIFGHLGFPQLGVAGAAVATVISRFVELGIVLFFTHRGADRYRFIQGIYRSFRVPTDLVKQITVKGLPLLVNEGLWSMGMATLTQCYSVRGLDVVAAMNISSTISNLFAVAFLSMGVATSIIVGQTLGANDMEGARTQAWRLIAFSIGLSLCTGVMLMLTASLFPRIYQTTADVRQLATSFLRIYACCMPLFSFANCAYFILRSGGKTMLTFAFDSGYTWVVGVPIAWCLVHLTGMPVAAVYLCVQLADFIKCAFGFYLLRKGIWLNNMVG